LDMYLNVKILKHLLKNQILKQTSVKSVNKSKILNKLPKWGLSLWVTIQTS
jgi:hypothetical protein